jgi:hypothetical protein
MKHGTTKWGVIVVGAVAALTLGAIGVASAASSPTAAPTPNASTQAGQADGVKGGHGTHDGAGALSHGGPGDLAQALANLSGKDLATIQQQREAGKSCADIAAAYGVSQTALLAEATKIETAELDAAVKAGTITDAQRTQYLAGLQDRLKAELTATDTHADGGFGGHHGGMGGGGDLAQALANLSGKDQATIMQQRAAGKSYADIAKAYGVSETALLAEATKLETAELDAAVKAGQMTDAQRTQLLSGLQAHLKEELTETGAMHGGHGDGDGDGPFGAGSGTSGTGSGTGTTQSSTTQTSYLTY